jgi:hypothetical protein
VAGSVNGAQVAVNLDEALMLQVIGCHHGAHLVSFIYAASQPLLQWRSRISAGIHLKYLCFFFLIGINGASSRPELDFSLLAGLGVGVGYDLVRCQRGQGRGCAARDGIQPGVCLPNVRWTGWWAGTRAGQHSGSVDGGRLALEKRRVLVPPLLVGVVAVSAAN